MERVVPFAVELVRLQVQGGELGIGDLEALLVGSAVQSGVDFQAGGGRGVANQLDHDLVIDQGLAAPVAGDVAEQTMFDLVPLRGYPKSRADITQ